MLKILIVEDDYRRIENFEKWLPDDWCVGVPRSRCSKERYREILGSLRFT